MEHAYLEYDPSNGKILGIHWKQPDKSFIKINITLATAFIDGSKKLHLYRVEFNGDSHDLTEVIEETTPPPNFWTFSTTDILDDIDIEVYESFVIVQSSRRFLSIRIHATLKNDPSWLVKSFDIDDLTKNNNMNVSPTLIKLDIPNAENYSYYIGIIDEI